MNLLYSNSKYKLNLFKKNTSIAYSKDIDAIYILKELKNINLDYVSVYLNFSCESVMKEISLHNSSKELLNLFGHSDLINKNTKDLSMSEIAVLRIVLELSKNKDYIILYDVLTYLDNVIKMKIINYLKEKNITIINFTSNEEEYLINPYMIVIDSGLVAIEGKTELVLQEEKLMKRLGFNLPFCIDVSKQLIAYGLVDKVFLDYKDLVGELWKSKS